MHVSSTEDTNPVMRRLTDWPRRRVRVALCDAETACEAGAASPSPSAAAESKASSGLRFAQRVAGGSDGLVDPLPHAPPCAVPAAVSVAACGRLRSLISREIVLRRSLLLAASAFVNPQSRCY